MNITSKYKGYWVKVIGAPMVDPYLTGRYIVLAERTEDATRDQSTEEIHPHLRAGAQFRVSMGDLYLTRCDSEDDVERKTVEEVWSKVTRLVDMSRTYERDVAQAVGDDSIHEAMLKLADTLDALALAMEHLREVTTCS